jgi:hypothetical protein
VSYCTCHMTLPCPYVRYIYFEVPYEQNSTPSLKHMAEMVNRCESNSVQKNSDSGILYTIMLGFRALSHSAVNRTKHIFLLLGLHIWFRWLYGFNWLTLVVQSLYKIEVNWCIPTFLSGDGNGCISMNAFSWEYSVMHRLQKCIVLVTIWICW